MDVGGGAGRDGRARVSDIPGLQRRKSRRQFRWRLPLPDSAAAGGHAGRVCRDGGRNAPHLGGLYRRRGRIPTGGLADLPSTASGFTRRHRQRCVHRLSSSGKYAAVARRYRERVFAPGTRTLTRLAIIGGGSWGTALSIVLAPRFSNVRLWVYEQDLAGRMRARRENDVYLPGFTVPSNVDVVAELEPALDGAEIVLGVMPSHRARGVYERMASLLDESMLLVSATKGLETGSLLRMSQVIYEVVGKRFSPKVSVLSGPTFAREVASGEPTALVVASTDSETAAAVQSAFSGATFRLYTNSDPAGVEIGGAVKNVVAIGAGVCHGLGLGSNALAALITRGLAEMTRLALAVGGQAKTLAGLSGLGDLLLTCTGGLSRNRKVGLELAAGRKLGEIVGSMQMIAEGIETTKATVDLARRHNVDMPIADQMHAMLYEARPPKEAIRQLM